MPTRIPIRPLIIREKSYTLHLVSALAFLLLAMTLDYRIELVQAQVATVASDARLLDCLNGTARWQGADGTQTGCLKAEVN